MTVRELIAKLEQCPQDAIVDAECDCGSWTGEGIDVYSGTPSNPSGWATLTDVG